MRFNVKISWAANTSVREQALLARVVQRRASVFTPGCYDGDTQPCRENATKLKRRRAYLRDYTPASQ